MPSDILSNHQSLAVEDRAICDLLQAEISKALTAEGKFKAAEARYVSLSDVKVTPLRRWLKKSREIQWDYKNIVKRRGVLERMK